MNYLVLSTPSEAYAAAISSALWGLARPPAIRSEKDTQLYTSWVVKPDASAVALFVPDDTRPVHEDADVQPLLDLIAPAVDEVELERISDYIDERRGGRFAFKEFLEGSSLAPNLRTHEQLKAEGWFPSDVI